MKVTQSVWKWAIIAAEVHHGYIWSANFSDSTFMQEPYVANLLYVYDPQINESTLISIVCMYIPVFYALFVTLQYAALTSWGWLVYQPVGAIKLPCLDNH